MRTKRLRAPALTPVAGLRPFGRRARTHSDEQIAAIAAAITAFGFNNPILLDENDHVLCGWGRVLAARLLALKEIPFLRITHLSKDEKRAYILADNKLALRAGWDDALLKIEFEELAAAGLDLALTGFEADELDALLLPSAGHSEPDAAPEMPAHPIARTGELWVLGRHRLLCGDATDKAAAAKLFGKAKPNLMVTDPPYGVKYDPAWRKRAGLSSDNAALGKVSNDDRADWREAWALFPGNVAYVWHSGVHCSAVHQSLEARDMVVRAQIIWVKSRPVVSRGHYHWQHEPAYYAVRSGKQGDLSFEADHQVAAYAVADGNTADWHGDRRQSTVWFINHLKSDTGHGTQKPVDCMRIPMLNNSKAGDPVYDPFLGSGTTLIAAEMAGRTCFGMELDPAYVDIAIMRWQAFAAAAAVLEGTRRTFDAVSSKRKAGK